MRCFHQRCLLAISSTISLIGVSSPAVADETRVRDLAISAEATDITFIKRRGDVRIQVTSDFKTMGGFYARKLAFSGPTGSLIVQLEADAQEAAIIPRAVRNESGERSGVSPPVTCFCTGKLTHAAHKFSDS